VEAALRKKRRRRNDQNQSCEIFIKSGMSFEKEKRIVHDLRKLSEDKSTQYEMVNQHAALPSLILFLHHQNQESKSHFSPFKNKTKKDC